MLKASFDEFLYISNLPMSISYPKNRIKVLLLENIHKDAVQLFKTEGYNVEVISKSLSEDELSEKIKDVSILGIRSKTVIIVGHQSMELVAGKQILPRSFTASFILTCCCGRRSISIFMKRNRWIASEDQTAARR